MQREVKIALGLGSNLNDRLINLQEAIYKLTDIITNIIASSIYQSKALLPVNAPLNWDMDFYNMVITGYTSLDPIELLRHIKEIEQELGRKPQKRWAPRVIDIDILIYGELVIDSDILSIPHISLFERDFVYIPLAEIWPHYQSFREGKYHGQSIKDIISNKSNSLIKLPSFILINKVN